LSEVEISYSSVTPEFVFPCNVENNPNQYVEQSPCRGNQFGGVKKGFSTLTYHVDTDWVVKKEPANPIARTPSSEIKSLTRFIKIIRLVV